MLESIQLSTVLPAIPERIYQAWLDTRAHSAFTGSEAVVDPRLGGRFTAWDGYIQGANLELEPYRRIVQSWRTTEFPEESPDSHLEILFEEVEGGTQITLLHTDIPEGQAQDYYRGWEDYYFAPMSRYFQTEG